MGYNTLSKFDYQGIEISFHSFYTFEGENHHNFSQYIPTALLVNGAWKEASEEALRASLSLAYTLNQKEFNLKIDDVRLRNSENSLQSGVMFCGSFPYESDGNTTLDKVNSINRLLEIWQEDLKIYQDIVEQKIFKLN